MPPDVAVLPVDDRVQVERAGDQDHAQDRHAQRDLVADELGAGAQAAEERVLVVRRPARQDHAVDRQAADREDVDDADVDARRDLELRPAAEDVRRVGPTGPNGTTAKPIVAAMIAITGARM